MRIRRMLLSVALAATLAGGAAGVALAGEGGPTGPTPERIAARCERGQMLLERLEARAAKLAEHIAAVEARLASGELTERQTARLERLLEHLQKRAEKLDERIARLSAKLAEKCNSSGETGGEVEPF